MRTEYDKEADAAYIYIKNSIGKGEVERTVKLDNSVILDFDKKNKLIGIEILNASKTLPETKGFLKLAA